MEQPTIKDPLTCDCETCEYRRRSGERLYRRSVALNWILRAVVGVLVVLGIAGYWVPAWAVGIGVFLGAIVGSIVTGFKIIIGDPTVRRTIKRIYEAPPIYVPFEEERRRDAGPDPVDGRVVAALQPGQRPDDPVLTLQAPTLEGEHAARRIMVASQIVALHFSLWRIACVTKDRPLEGLLRYQRFIGDVQRAQAPSDLLGYGDVGKPLTVELLDDIFASYLRQLRVDEDIRS